MGDREAHGLSCNFHIPVSLSSGTVSAFVISASYSIFFDSAKSGEGRKPQ